LPIIKTQSTYDHIQHNYDRVHWIRSFVSNVSLQAHPEKASLEEKIERLQKRLGGRPLQIAESLQKLDDEVGKERERKLMEEFR
jgi:hypothetical protein